MLRLRNYWTYSAGLAIALVIVVTPTHAVGGAEKAHTTLLVAVGFCIGWLSTTIARYVYPPPKRWRSEGFDA
jgi:hypothetical protein